MNRFLWTVSVIFLLILFVSGCGKAQPEGSNAPGNSAGTGVPADSANPQKPATTDVDLSTDEGVATAYKQISGGKYVPFIFRPEGLDGVIMLQTNIPDDGTDHIGVFVGQVFYPNGQDITPVLRYMGWDKANSQGRVEIVRKWLKKSSRLGGVVDKPIRSPMEEAHNAEPSNTKIKTAVFEATPEGGVKCDFWVVDGWNIAGHPMYEHRRITFDKDAKLVK